jgi:hypothetical protein
MATVCTVFVNYVLMPVPYLRNALIPFELAFWAVLLFPISLCNPFLK